MYTPRSSRSGAPPLSHQQLSSSPPLAYKTRGIYNLITPRSSVVARGLGDGRLWGGCVCNWELSSNNERRTLAAFRAQRWTGDYFDTSGTRLLDCQKVLALSRTQPCISAHEAILWCFPHSNGSDAFLVELESCQPQKDQTESLNQTYLLLGRAQASNVWSIFGDNPRIAQCVGEGTTCDLRQITVTAWDWKAFELFEVWELTMLVKGDSRGKFFSPFSRQNDAHGLS